MKILKPARAPRVFDGKLRLTLRCLSATADCEGALALRAKGTFLGRRVYHLEPGGDGRPVRHAHPQGPTDHERQEPAQGPGDCQLWRRDEHAHGPRERLGRARRPGRLARNGGMAGLPAPRHRLGRERPRAGRVARPRDLPRGHARTIAAGIADLLETRVPSARRPCRSPGTGSAQDVLDETDVLTWWGHAAHEEVDERSSSASSDAVLGGMGLLALHSGHYSKPLRGCSARPAACAGATRASGSSSGPSRPSHPSRRASRTRS